MTTNATGQATFAVPFTAPAGLPIITATATDPQGNTSEVSALRQGDLEVPAQTIRLSPGQPVTFAAASSDGIVLRDPDAGPLNPVWDLTLSVAAGTLTLATTAGLSGTGDGTGSLTYSGPLSALKAALDGMTFVPPAGYQGNPALTLEAQSDGAATISSQVAIVVTTGQFEVTTTADSGPGSLRQAILDSNSAAGGTNTIHFAILGTGVQTIVAASPLPAITDPLIIDGTTQPGYAGAPLITIVGQGAGDDPLSVDSDVTVRGVTLGGSSFSTGTSSAMLTVEAVPLSLAQQSVVTYQIVLATGADLVATAQAVGTSTSMSLSDSQGRIIMQSDGLSSAESIDAIDADIGPGTYSLQVRDTAGNGSFTLTTMFMPSTTPFQPVPVGTDPDAMVSGDFNDDGKLDLAVANAGSNTVSILIGNGDGTFQPAVDYAVGNDPSAITTGDFTGDGRLDLAVANESSGTVSVLLGLGDGTFQPAVDYPVGTSPEGIVAGDINDDGHLDMAVANSGSNDISILLGNGDGTFQPAVDDAAGTEPDAIVAGDFNGDGRLDLAVADHGDESFGGSGTDPGGVSVLLGNSDGSFQPAVHYGAGAEASSLVAGDFTGNGRLDLAVIDWIDENSPQGQVSVLLGNGDGTFQPGVQYAVGFFPTVIVASDFTGDGHLDLAVATNSESLADNATVSLLRGNGDGTFQPARNCAFEEGIDSLVAGDFTGDGRLDLALADQVSSTVSILPGDGDGTFQTQAENPVSSPNSIAAGDFNGDGRLDLAVTDENTNEVSILLGNGDGTFQPAVQYAVGQTPEGIVAGDFNGDGRLDLAVANSNSGSVSVLLGNGDGTFQPAQDYKDGFGPWSIVAGHFTGDGPLDLAVTNPFDGTVSVLLGNADGTFQPQVTYAVGFESFAITAGDFTGGGHIGLAVANYVDNTVSVLLGNGDGTFQPQVTYPVGENPIAIVAGDFTGDGRSDLAVANSTYFAPGSVSILLNNGDGTFQPQITYPLGGEPTAIVVGDFAGDGHLDLAVADSNFPAGEVSVLLGNGDGTFQPAVTYASAFDILAMVVGDFNGDGRSDLADPNYFSNDISVLLSNSEGALADAGQFATTPFATPLVADVNGDGTDDVLVVDGKGDILYRQGIPGQPGNFEPPVTVHPVDPSTGVVEYPSRDIVWVRNTLDGPLLASVDAHDDAISLFAFRDGSFVRIGSLVAGQLPAQIIAADLNGSGWDDLVVRDAGDGTLSVFFNNRARQLPGVVSTNPSCRR